MTLEKVKQVLSHPLVYPYIRNDGWPEDPKEMDLSLVFPHATYFMPNPGTVFVFSPFMTNVWNMHVAATPEYRGIKTRSSGKKALDFAFHNLGAYKLCGFIPEWNQKSIRYALSHGFKVEGCLTRSTIRNGALYGIIIVGLDFEDWFHSRSKEVE